MVRLAQPVGQTDGHHIKAAYQIEQGQITVFGAQTFARSFGVVIVLPIAEALHWMARVEFGGGATVCVQVYRETVTVYWLAVLLLFGTSVGSR